MSFFFKDEVITNGSVSPSILIMFSFALLQQKLMLHFFELFSAMV